MIISSSDAEYTTVISVAKEMAVAARTAPKTCGEDSIQVVILTDADKDALCQEMFKIAENTSMEFIAQDGKNILECPCIILIGVKDEFIGLENCTLCGYGNCKNCSAGGGTCAFKLTDLGIAIGSAVSIAADHRIDNRVMYSAGTAAVSLGLFHESVKSCYGIPLSATCRNPFFDRAEQSGEIITAR